MKNIGIVVYHFLKDRFNLSHEQDEHLLTIKYIEKGVDFKGVNVWLLIFAIFVASIGLNVNSTAVIIGAMLISPLMGPIMGLGLSVGIYDFVLLKRSFKNLTIAVIISVLTSTLYFLISPLNEAQSELLARTTPTIYDVLIALFGGLAGIVAGATKEKGNAIPGVAIATALMPPLCTAGFGLATGNIYFFLGAFYLFFINAVMISLSTFLVVRFLNFPLVNEVNKQHFLKVRQTIYIIVIITVLPSIYFAYKIVQQTFFETNAKLFVNKEFNFENTQIISKTFVYQNTDSSLIEIILTGQTIDSNYLIQAQRKLVDYSLSKTKLIVRQGIEGIGNIDINRIKSGIIEDIYKKNEQLIQNKEEKIKMLENELMTIKSNTYDVTKLGSEINAINNKINKFSAYKTEIYNVINNKSDTTILVYLSVNQSLTKQESRVLQNWLKVRFNYEKIVILSE